MNVWWGQLMIHTVLALWGQVQTVNSQQPANNEVQLVYVSQTRGNDRPSCGSESNPCRTIVMGVWRVQNNGRVYVDGTGSETNPYTCKSSTLVLAGIHSNKSMVIIGVQSIAHVKCQEGYDIRLHQSLLVKNETTVTLTNLKFVDTSVSALDISLYIDNCNFTGVWQAVNLVQSTRAVTLSFDNSLCVNISGCIATSITRRITPKNKVSIYVTNSNIVVLRSKYRPISPDQSSGILVTSTGEYDPGSIICDIALKNVSFKDNVLGSKGLIYMNLKNGHTSLYLEDVVFLESKTVITPVNIITILGSYNHDMILNNTKFLGGWCRAIQVETQNKSSLCIVNSQFEKFQAGLLYLISSRHSEVHMENTVFTSNTAQNSMGGILSLISQNATVTIKNSTFSDNHGGCGGILWLSVKDFIATRIQDCHFESNSADGPGGLAAFRGHGMNIEVIDSRIIRSSSHGPGGVFDIGYTGCGSSQMHIDNLVFLFKNVEVTGSTGEGFGGVLSIGGPNNGSITIEDSIIRDTLSTGPGGVIAVQDPGTSSLIGYDIKILNSTFNNSCSMGPGGVVYASGVRQLTLETVTIASGHSDGAPGGGLYIESLTTVTVNITDTVITKCRAGGAPGGALYFHSVSTLSIINTVFMSNTASNGPGGAGYFDSVSTLRIINTVFESNIASHGPGGSLYFPGGTGTSDMLLRNVTFKDCYSLLTPSGALHLGLAGGQIRIESCKFLGNSAPTQVGGAISFYEFANRDKIIDPGCIGKHSSVSESIYARQDSVPHRVWSYNTSVTIKDTLFANNTAINGGAVALSRGKYTFQNCSFIDNFGKLQGGHIFITSDSTSLQVLNSSFLQQRSSKMVQLPKKNVEFRIGSFIDSESVGPLVVLNSTLEYVSLQGGPKTLVTVSKANYVDFGDNNQTVLSCPRGSELDIVNMSTQINTEYKSHECKIVLNVMQLICKPCGIGTYSLQHGHSLGLNRVSGFHCLPCPFGAECFNKIAAKPNFWGYKVQENPPALNFTLCPVGYCKQPDKNDFVDYNSCYGNRNGTLCGECKENYTETLLSTSCRRQDECQDTWLWGGAVAMVLLMALYLVHKPRFSRMLKRNILWFRSNTSEENEEDQPKDDHGGGYLKIVFYFYQVANILLITTSYDSIVESYLLQPVVGLFNFEFRFSSRGLLCPFFGLTAVTKQLLIACPVFGVVLMTAVCYGCHCLLHKCMSKSPPTLGPYLGAVLETLLLGYSVLVNTALKLVRCTSLGGETWLFIAGNVLCYQWWQYLLMVFVVVAVVPFIVTLAFGSKWLYKGSISIKEFVLGCVMPLPYLMYKLISLLCGPRETRPEPPEWKASVTAVLYGPFRKPKHNTTGAIYWESILISRRLVLIIIYVFVPDPLSKELTLTLSCVAILFHHTIVRPFRSQAANIAEMMSLFSLVVIAIVNTFKASFLSNGQVPQGPLQSFSHVLDWIQAIILTAGPVLCFVVVVVAVVSQLIRLGIKVYCFVTCSCIKSRAWHMGGNEVRCLLEPDNFEDSDSRT